MTVERFDPAIELNKMVLDHYARYLFAAPLARGQRVLDAACGFGYGSRLLAELGASAVLGADLSAEAIAYAHEHYPHKRVSYICKDLLLVTPEQEGVFDCIVCFETLEHVSDPGRTLDTLADLLGPNGIFVVSVPNDIGLGVENPFHLSKFTQEAFVDLLRARFKQVRLHYQNYLAGSLIWRPDDLAVAADGMAAIEQLQPLIYGDSTTDARQSDCFLAVCGNSDAVTLDLPPLSVQSGAIWRDLTSYITGFEHSRAWLEGQIASWRAEAERLKRSVADERAGKAWLEEQYATWQAEAERREQLLQEQQAWINQIQIGKTWLEEQYVVWKAEARRLADELSEVERLRTELDKQHQDMAAIQEARIWHEQQHSNWKAEAERLAAMVAEQASWIKELEQAKAWHEQQRASWEANGQRRLRLRKLRPH